MDLSPKTTLFVGANSNGKTSAMLAAALQRRVMLPFEIHDFTLCHLKALVDIGEAWVQAHQADAAADISVTSLGSGASYSGSTSLQVEEDGFRFRLIPLMEWTGGRLGVQSCATSQDLKALFKEFIIAVTEANAMRAAAAAAAAVKGAEAKVDRMA